MITDVTPKKVKIKWKFTLFFRESIANILSGENMKLRNVGGDSGEGNVRLWEVCGKFVGSLWEVCGKEPSQVRKRKIGD